MSIQQTATTSFKVELLQAIHNFGPTTPNTFKVALYTAASNIGPTTTVYTTTGEVPNGGGYTTGGDKAPKRKLRRGLTKCRRCVLEGSLL